jgi:high-affinity iron transporter
MLAEFIVMFRESIEAAFIIGLIIAYLHKTKNERFEKFAHLGIAAGIIGSIILAFLIQSYATDVHATSELFEGLFMLAAVALISWLLLWLVEQKNFVEKLKSDVALTLEDGKTTALFFLVFFSVLREGAEAVLFLSGIYFSTGAISILGALLGLVAALVLGFLVFEHLLKFNLRLFFKVTTALLVLIAAGMLSQGIHELQEAKILPEIIEHVYDINPPKNPDGTYHLLHEKGSIGGTFKALLGYDGNPSLLQIISYLAYLIGFSILYWKKSETGHIK